MVKYIAYEVRIYESGTREWLARGKFHRQDGPAIERVDGTKFWYLNGRQHRENGPAVEYPDGAKWWYLKGKLHREDGPAIENQDGEDSWFLNDEKVTQRDVMDAKLKRVNSNA